VDERGRTQERCQENAVQPHAEIGITSQARRKRRSGRQLHPVPAGVLGLVQRRAWDVIPISACG
jgi:hypothetical protein